MCVCVRWGISDVLFKVVENVDAKMHGKKLRGWRCGSVIESLPSSQEALGLISSTEGKK
jgi:hypothetical protein